MTDQWQIELSGNQFENIHYLFLFFFPICASDAEITQFGIKEDKKQPSKMEKVGIVFGTLVSFWPHIFSARAFA